MPVFRSKVTSKGQVTIPLEVRKRLGLHQGDQLEFETGKADTIIRPVRPATESVSQFRGIAKGTFPDGMSAVNAWIREIRGDWDGDED